MAAGLGLLLLLVAPAVFAQCPWQSFTSRWSQLSPPDDFVIGAGMNVLFDSTNAVLNSIYITNGGRLVWDNAPGLSLDVHWIVIDKGGRFDMGSEACPITQDATITLSGLSTDAGGTLVAPNGFGNKVIGVGFNGTWEVHGKIPRPAWARLTRTVPGTLPQWTNANGAIGLNVVTVDPITGTVSAQTRYDTYNSATAADAFAAYINGLPNNTVVLITTYDSAERLMNENARRAAESLGSLRVRQLTLRVPWGFIGVKNGFVGQTLGECLNTTQGAVCSANATLTIPGFTVRAAVTGSSWRMPQLPQISMTISVFPSSQVYDPTLIRLDQPVDWQAGDHIAIASTDYDYKQSEERVLVACAGCAANEVRIDQPCRYMHYGEITWGVDERAEVGLLSRKIVIQGKMEAACYGAQPCASFPFDTWGGHTRVLRNFSSVHIEGAEFYHMGQTVIGSYPIHFHMCHDVDTMVNPPYVKHNSIHHSFDRCVTIHGTNGLLVQNNFAFDHMGHCYFFEDGAEMRNVLDNNVGLLTRPGYVLPSDRNKDTCLAVNPVDFNGAALDWGQACSGVTTFWVTNPNNVLTNNVAGGSDRFGFWYIFPDYPQGLSFNYYGTQLGNLHNIPFGVFANNTAHSNGENGLFLDDTIQRLAPTAASPFPLGSIIHAGRYKPRTTLNDFRTRTLTVWYRYTAYKNRNRGVWVRGGEHRFYHLRVADNAIGATFASEGTMPNEPGSTQDCYDCIFVGQTDNKGTWELGARVAEANIQMRDGFTQPQDVSFPLRGYEVYDGPNEVTYARFYRFFSTTSRNASAVGYLLNDNWQLTATNNMTLLRFGEGVANRLYHGRENENWFGRNDGARNQIVTSADGTLDPQGVGGSFVNWNEFFRTPECVAYPAMQAQRCENHFGQLFLYNNNPGQTNFVINSALPAWGGQWATKSRLTFVRDDKPTYFHEMWTPGAFPGTGPNVHMPLLIYGKSYTLHWNHPTPPSLKFDLVNFEKQKWVRFGICYGLGQTTLSFSIRNNTNNALLTPGSSLADVDNSVTGAVYWWDVNSGLLFVKVVAPIGRYDNYYCPPVMGSSVKCEGVTVATINQNKNISGNCTLSAYPLYALSETPGSPPTPPPPLGATVGLQVRVPVKLATGSSVNPADMAADFAKLAGTSTSAPRFAVTSVQAVSPGRVNVEFIISPKRTVADESVDELWARFEPMLSAVNSALGYVAGLSLNRWTPAAVGVSRLMVEIEHEVPPVATPVSGLVTCPGDNTLRLVCPVSSSSAASTPKSSSSAAATPKSSSSAASTPKSSSSAAATPKSSSSAAATPKSSSSAASTPKSSSSAASTPKSSSSAAASTPKSSSSAAASQPKSSSSAVASQPKSSSSAAASQAKSSSSVLAAQPKSSSSGVVGGQPSSSAGGCVGAGCTTTPNDDTSENAMASVPVMAGAAAGGLVVLLVALAVVCLCVRNRRAARARVADNKAMLADVGAAEGHTTLAVPSSSTFAGAPNTGGERDSNSNSDVELPPTPGNGTPPRRTTPPGPPVPPRASRQAVI